jgi:hypothetical protein
VEYFFPKRYIYANTENRVGACREHALIPLIIEPCEHINHTYTWTGTTPQDTHTKHCPNCVITFAPELHHFPQGSSSCSVCKVGSTLYDVKIYLPQDQGGGTYDGQSYNRQYTYQMVDGKIFNLPSSPVIVPGLEFKGWFETDQLAGDTYESSYTTSGEILRGAGSEYTVSKNVCFVARYQNLDISLADNADNSETLNNYGGMTAYSVTLSGRTLYKDDKWNTLCLPFSLASLTGTPLEGATLKELDVDGWYDSEGARYNDEASGRHQTGFDKGTLYLYFKDASSIVAGKPYLIKWASGSNITSPVFSNVTIHSTFTGVVSADGTLDFIGTYSPMTIAGENKTMLYLAGDNNLYYPNAAMTLNACRAYFQLYGIEAGDIVASRLFFGEDDPTGILSLSKEPGNQGNKPVDYYTLDGRKLSGKPTTKGLYINNGRKIVIK